MENEPDLIRDQMQETRMALTDKLEALEKRVVSTVQDTTSTVAETVSTVKKAVEDTVGTVKDTVQNTVDTVSGTMQQTVSTVKETFDLPRQVDRHPWLMLAGSVAAGFVAGQLLPSASAGSRKAEQPRGFVPSSSRFPESLARNTAAEAPGHNGAKAKEAGEEENWLGGMLEPFREEIEKLEGLGIAAVVGVMRDLVTQSVKGEIGERLGEWMNGLTEKLGGKPLREPILESASDEPAEARSRR